MKTREIRDRVRSMGHERGILYCLEAINEELIQTRRDIKELATYFDQLVSSMDSMLIVAGNMRAKIDQVEGRGEELNELLGPNTNDLGRDNDD